MESPQLPTRGKSAGTLGQLLSAKPRNGSPAGPGSVPGGTNGMPPTGASGTPSPHGNGPVPAPSSTPLTRTMARLLARGAENGEKDKIKTGAPPPPTVSPAQLAAADEESLRTLADRLLVVLTGMPTMVEASPDESLANTGSSFAPSAMKGGGGGPRGPRAGRRGTIGFDENLYGGTVPYRQNTFAKGHPRHSIVAEMLRKQAEEDDEDEDEGDADDAPAAQAAPNSAEATPPMAPPPGEPRAATRGSSPTTGREVDNASPCSNSERRDTKATPVEQHMIVSDCASLGVSTSSPHDAAVPPAIDVGAVGSPALSMPAAAPAVPSPVDGQLADEERFAGMRPPKLLRESMDHEDDAAPPPPLTAVATMAGQVDSAAAVSAHEEHEPQPPDAPTTASPRRESAEEARRGLNGLFKRQSLSSPEQSTAPDSSGQAAVTPSEQQPDKDHLSAGVVSFDVLGSMGGDDAASEEIDIEDRDELNEVKPQAPPEDAVPDPPATAPQASRAKRRQSHFQLPPAEDFPNDRRDSAGLPDDFEADYVRRDTVLAAFTELLRILRDEETADYLRVVGTGTSRRVSNDRRISWGGKGPNGVYRRISATINVGSASPLVANGLLADGMNNKLPGSPLTAGSEEPSRRASQQAMADGRRLTITVHRGSVMSLASGATPRAGTPTMHTTDAMVGEPEFDGSFNINQYVVLDHIGSGRQGTVHLAFDPTSNEFRAIKALSRPRAIANAKPANGAFSGNGHANGDAPVQPLECSPRAAGSSIAAARQRNQRLQLEREVTIMKRLRHPNIVRLYEVIDDPRHETLYLVMQYVEHKALVDVRRDGTIENPVQPTLLANYAAQIASGLQYLHARGILHRDIKPDNILRGQNDQVYLSDFGMSEAFEAAQGAAAAAVTPSASGGPSPTMTPRVEQTKGTVAFMAPELLTSLSEQITPSSASSHAHPRPVNSAQAFSPEAIAAAAVETSTRKSKQRRATPAIDVWALGVTLHLLLYGKFPWRLTGHFATTVDQIIGAPIVIPPPPSPPPPELSASSPPPGPAAVAEQPQSPPAPPAEATPAPASAPDAGVDCLPQVPEGMPPLPRPLMERRQSLAAPTSHSSSLNSPQNERSPLSAGAATATGSPAMRPDAPGAANMCETQPPSALQPAADRSVDAQSHEPLPSTADAQQPAHEPSHTTPARQLASSELELFSPGGGPPSGTATAAPSPQRAGTAPLTGSPRRPVDATAKPDRLSQSVSLGSGGNAKDKEPAPLRAHALFADSDETPAAEKSPQSLAGSPMMPNGVSQPRRKSMTPKQRLDEAWAALLRQMLARDAKQRPSMDEVCARVKELVTLADAVQREVDEAATDEDDLPEAITTLRSVDYSALQGGSMDAPEVPDAPLVSPAPAALARQLSGGPSGGDTPPHLALAGMSMSGTGSPRRSGVPSPLPTAGSPRRVKHTLASGSHKSPVVHSIEMTSPLGVVVSPTGQSPPAPRVHPRAARPAVPVVPSDDPAQAAVRQ